MMSARNGGMIPKNYHIQQSIHKILTTNLGSLLMLPDFGSEIFDLIDAPVNEVLILLLQSATFDALARWEPRIIVEAVEVTISMGGIGVLEMSYRVIATGMTDRTTVELI